MDDKTAACCFDLGAFFVQKCHTRPAVKVRAVRAVAALLKKQRVLSLLWRQKHLGGECLKGSFYALQSFLEAVGLRRKRRV